MSNRKIKGNFRSVLKMLLVVATFTSWPVIAHAQFTASGNDIYNTNSGNVGVGTATPLSKLDVKNATDQHLLVEAGTTRGGADGIGLTSLNDANTAYKGITLSGTTIVMNATAGTGNVAIGTASAYRRLVVSGAPSTDGDSSSQIEIQSDVPYNASPISGLSFGLKYNSGGLIAIGTSIQGYKENSTDGNFAQALRFTTQAHAQSPATRMTISSAGNVGIGTTTPSTALHVVGDLTVSGNISAKYQDLAEWVPARRALEPGTVVIQDPDAINSVTPSSESYDTRVVGVISNSPGIILGVAGEGKVRVATTGRVKVHVDATHGPIRAGDLLVTSGREGTAMRSDPIDVAGAKIHRPGTLIGKALEPLGDGEGEILVLLSLQ